MPTPLPEISAPFGSRPAIVRMDVTTLRHLRAAVQDGEIERVEAALADLIAMAEERAWPL